MDAKGKLGNLDDAVSACAKAEHHGELEQRLGFLEAFIGEHRRQGSFQAGQARDMEQLAEHYPKAKSETYLDDTTAWAKGSQAEVHNVLMDCAWWSVGRCTP